MMAAGSAMLSERTEGSRDYYLKVDMPAVKGTHLDLVIPMIPGDADEVRAEADLGYDAALAQSDKYWSERPETAAVVDTPEPQVNRAVRRMVELAQVISETNPENGDRAREQQRAYMRGLGVDLDALSDEERTKATSRHFVGDPDEVAADLQTRVLEPGVDGLIINLVTNGHEPGVVDLAGRTLRKLVG